MAYRWALLIMLCVAVSLVGATVGFAPRFEAVFRQLPGGMEGLPGLTRALLASSRWIRVLWPVVVLALIAAFVVVPHLLRRSERGRRRVEAFDRYLERYAPLVGALFLMAVATTLYVALLALFLPLLKIIEHLTSR